MKILFVFLASLICQIAWAKTYIRADAYVEVKSGKTIGNAIIVVEDGRIESTKGNLNDAGPDDEVIDLAGKTLMPGLFDMHVHLIGNKLLKGAARVQESDQLALLAGVENARKLLMAGVTTVRSLGSSSYGDIALRDGIRAGYVIGPRVFASGPALGITGGHCDNNWMPRERDIRNAGVANGPWEVAAKVRENIKFGSDVIKFCATGGVMSKGTKVGVQQYTLEEMQTLVSEAHRRGLIVAAHAHGTSGIKDAIRAGVDSVEHASYIDDEGIQLAVENGTYLSMDIYVTEYILGQGIADGIPEENIAKERTVGKIQRSNFTKAVEAGVKMVMGTDAGVYPGFADSPKQLSRMVTFGMTPAQALQAATINAATLLKKQDEMGSLEEGKLADIIAVAGNPLEDISLLEDVTFVMKEGRVYKR
ncbi:MAG: amidohydrolase family protein [Pseudomonadales bacterium]|nr:amidohydrolase family protein [Pseudomonadales bacterium]